MTLEQYTYLAEIAGVVAVIFSLIYVGKQIKQNANAMKMNAMSIHAQQVSQIRTACSSLRRRESTFGEPSLTCTGRDCSKRVLGNSN
jgi:hypothetical protein